MGASMMQPLHCLPHGLRALRELCSLTEINCLHCPLSLLQWERQRVDGVDFITSHFHTKGGAGEVLGLSVSPSSA